MSGKGARWATLLVSVLLAGMTAAPALAAPAAHHPVHGSVRVELHGTFALYGGVVTVPWRTIYVTGFVRPYVPGQWVNVFLMQHGKILRHKRVRVRAARGGDKGYFRVKVASSVTGNVKIRVVHRVTGRMSFFSAPRRLRILSPQASFGQGGPFVRLMQQRMSYLHFYIPLTGVYDSGMGLALDAYHRLRGWGTSQALDSQTIKGLLDGAGTFHIHFPGHGRHAEGDLSDQLLALINGNKVYWILPISSGKPSTPTILGDYQIYYREPGYNSEGMFYSDYFIRGYAIHGYDPAPDYPASHGCMRLPIVDAIPVYNWLALGDWVDTYYG